jgi:anti-sigma regulatory factor (Ser/Thr protein kinase)
MNRHKRQAKIVGLRELLDATPLDTTLLENDDAQTKWDESLDRMELQFTLSNDMALIELLVSFLRQQAVAFGLCQTTLEEHVGVALQEALENAMLHGNLEFTSDDLRRRGRKLSAARRGKLIDQRLHSQAYRNRRIHVHAEFSHDGAVFSIRDEGPGFDYAVCTPLVIDDGELARPGGHGLLLMYSFMDEVRFNDRGNVVTMKLVRAA